VSGVQDIRHSQLAGLLAAATLAMSSVCCAAGETPASNAVGNDAARMMNELMSGKAQIGGPFSLTDQYGQRRSLADFQGKLVLLYFGYISCPDVCPTDLLAIAYTTQLADKDGIQVQPIFITLDPERDTQEILRSYVASFDPRFVALRGNEHDIKRIAN
jgi:protein SCO1/2